MNRYTDRNLLDRIVRAAACLLMTASLLLSSPGSAVAAPAKKKEVEAGPTKSYTVPYMIVLAVLGIGLMTVCRPSSRLEKASDKLKEEDKD